MVFKGTQWNLATNKIIHNVWYLIKKQKQKNTTRHAKKQEIVNQNLDKKKSIETDTKSISMIELTDKDIKNQLL